MDRVIAGGRVLLAQDGWMQRCEVEKDRGGPADDEGSSETIGSITRIDSVR